MSLQKLINNYAGYNMWANETLINFLRTKPAENMKEEVASSFSSVAKTLNHILATQEFWYSVVTETENKSTRWNAEEVDVQETFEALIQHSEQFDAWVKQLSESDLVREVNLDTPWIKGRLSIYEFLQHVFNHSTYHRGQVITIGRQLGFTDAPMTDYNYYNMARTAVVY
ncbi:MAG: DinB family protein [Chryseolinea sp.]